MSRIRHPGLRGKATTADAAAAMIPFDRVVAMSGFTSGYPKAVPQALARRIAAEHQRGGEARIQLWTGASTGPELDGALAAVDGLARRLPYNADPTCRDKINSGEIEYLDMHLSQVAPAAWEGALGSLDTAVIEVCAIREDGALVPSSSVGNNKTWLDCARQVILEVNRWQSDALDGMHDIYYGTALPPHRRPIPLTAPHDRIGETAFRCDPDKIVAIVETDLPDHAAKLAAPGEAERAIAGCLVEFFSHEVAKGRLPPSLLPLQSGVGNIANAVLAALGDGPFRELTAYTEVLQDAMLELLDQGIVTFASSTALSLSETAAQRINARMSDYRDRIVLRPQEISNHPELIRRLGCISMNGMIEAGIYGTVNSTHVMGSKIQNGIGGSGDFARNAFLSIFMAPSTAKGGAISTIVPQPSHIDHVNQDVQVIVTEQGLADLRGLSPKERAKTVIANCAHPDYREQLWDYFDRARRGACGLHSPMLLSEALAWRQRFIDTGSMRA